MKDDLHFLRLFDLYAPLLTPNRREIAQLYFDFDLSLGEIAEQKGVSRQSVSDCLAKCRKQLETYDKKLGFSAYVNAVSQWIEKEKAAGRDNAEGLERALNGVLKQLDEIEE